SAAWAGSRSRPPRLLRHDLARCEDLWDQIVLRGDVDHGLNLARLQRRAGDDARDAEGALLIYSCPAREQIDGFGLVRVGVGGSLSDDPLELRDEVLVLRDEVAVGKPSRLEKTVRNRAVVQPEDPGLARIDGVGYERLYLDDGLDATLLECSLHRGERHLDELHAVPVYAVLFHPRLCCDGAEIVERGRADRFPGEIAGRAQRRARGD